MWDVTVTFILMFFGAFTMIFWGALLIWVLYLLQNEADND
jgi:hypothetical protein